MAAWEHTRYWTDRIYQLDYRNFVAANAPAYEGRTADCADLSITLIIEFAAQNGLPLTFFDTNRIVYASKGHKPSSRAWNEKRSFAWKTKDEYMTAVLARVNAKCLVDYNLARNPRGPEPGDLMISSEHAALVFRVWPSGVPHPLADRYDAKDGIPAFPGPQQAAREVNTTRYFRDDPTGPVRSPWQHIDYLNHRGEGSPKKQKAELIYFADVQAMRSDGFDFRSFSPSVRNNWKTWDGTGDPPE